MIRNIVVGRPAQGVELDDYHHLVRREPFAPYCRETLRVQITVWVAGGRRVRWWRNRFADRATGAGPRVGSGP